MAEAADDRTEAATPRRLARAREEGQVALSREVGTAATLALAAILLGAVLPGLCRHAVAAMASVLARADTLTPTAALVRAGRAGAILAGTVALAAMATGVLAVVGQTGPFARLAAIAPDFSRISPRAGLVRLFGPASVTRAGGALLKLAAVVFAVSTSWRGVGPWPWRSGHPEPAAALGADLLALTLRTIIAVLVVQALVAAVDLFRVRRQHAAKLRMSLHEVREEARDADGDPRIKARIRRLRTQRARQRMMAAVPTATVVVTNPTHYAVALAYARGGNAAPRVVAKGMDAVAARIREAAAEARVPLVANPALARALYKVELDAEIPADLFAGVAEVIALVWRLRAPRAVAGPPS